MLLKRKKVKARLREKTNCTSFLRWILEIAEKITFACGGLLTLEKATAKLDYVRNQIGFL